MPTPVLRSKPFAASRERTRAARGAPEGAAGSVRARDDRPIVAAVEASGASVAAAREAAQIAVALDAPLVFVYVRRWPWDGLGAPYHQRRLDTEMDTARRALAAALTAAEEKGVAAEAEILEGKPARRVLEFASHRDARLLVLGSRRRRIGRSVSRRVIRTADRPVVVATLSPIGPVAVA